MKQFYTVFTIVFLLIVVGVPVIPAQKTNIREIIAASGAWDCYDDGSPDPCHNNLNSIAMISSTDGWAVGDNGTILHWDGSTWAQMNSPTTADLASVAMASSTDGWAVGGWGSTVILHWNGSEWSSSNAPATSGLNSVAVVSPTNVWAVGYYGKILHWDGNQWGEISSPTDYTLRSISMVSSSDGWAAGNGGTILRWNGANWTTFTSPTTEALYSVSMASSTDGWTVSWGGTMLRWNGSTWTEFDYDPEQLWLCGLSFVLAISPTNAWGLGQNCNANGTLIHWDGASWNKAGYAYEVLVAFDVVPGSGGNQGWAAGRGGRLARWDGSQLTPAPDNNTVALNSVEMLAPNDGWVVGYNANSDAPTLHWDGTNWSERGREWLSDTSFISAQNGWAVGPFGNIIHWDGSNWTEITRMQHALNAIDMLSATDGWAVGGGSYVGCEQGQENCSLIVYWNGSTWSTVANPSPYGLLGISMLSATDGWAVGGSQYYCPAETNCSTILRWNGTQWSRLDSPTTKSLYAIAMNSATDGWAVGANGAILKWNGVAWLVFSSPVTSHLYSIAMFSATDGWIVGAQGTILHWNGTTWTKIDSPVTSSLLGVAYASETEVWAVGSNGVIIRYVAPSAGLAINYPNGAPGSYFTIMGSNFPPNSTANITVNGNGLGTVPTDSSGGLTFLLETSQADEGDYIVTASVNPAASVSFELGSSQPMRPQEGTGPIFNVPAGIAYTHGIYLPLIRK